jgi:O-methyltransferase/methyltransferase family protein
VDETAVARQTTLTRLLDGFITTQLLYVAAKLGIAEILADGPQRGEDIADAVGADRDALRRVLRGLVTDEVLSEEDDGRFALSPVGRWLGSMSGAALARGEVYYSAAAGLLAAVRSGGTAFEHVHGERFFDHLARHPDREAAFQASMAVRSEQEARDVVAAYDFSGFRRLVDVGGGRGVLLATILRAHPSLQAVLTDRETAIADARAHLQALALDDRAECVAADFFETVPSDADAYLLSRVIHDWDDRDARRILGSCRQAMQATSRLLIVEAILPERAHDRPAAIRMDLHMLVLLGARERTEAQFRGLLDSTGFRVHRVVMTESPAGLGVIEATPV